MRHAVFRKILTPIRDAGWSRKNQPFLHEGAKGLSFFLYPGEFVDRFIFIDGIYEARFLRFIERFIKPTRTMLDIGANIGNHSLYLSGLFDSIHSFEPNPTAIERLQRNIAANDIDNITIHPLGLGAEDAQLPFMASVESNLGCAHFQDQENEDSIFLDVVKGDPYVEGLAIEHIDFIKLDVEGFEMSVLEGLKETIDRHRPIVAFEYHAHRYEKDYFDNFRQILKGYVFVELVFAPAEASNFEKTVFNFIKAGTPDIRVIDVPESRTYENILAVPSDKRLSELLAG